jgi:ABC-type uncharacterized transport system substrate-binding protein
VKRRAFITVLIGAAAALVPAPAPAQARLPRLGYLWIGSQGTDGPTLGGLRAGLADHGYIEGQTVVLERRYADGHLERLPAIVQELIALPVDVILTPGTLAALAVQKATKTIPVVVTAGDPVGSGLVGSLARPGGNITGLSLKSSSETFAGKWIELLKEAVPGLSRIVVLHNVTNAVSISEMGVIEGIAPKLGVKIVRLSVGGDGLREAIARVAEAGITGLIVTDDPLIASMRQSIIDIAAEQRLPAMYGLDEFVPAGGLMSYSSSIFDIWRRVGAYIDRILKGASPADLPVEQPTSIALRINMRTARALGIVIPQSLLARADEVIE